MTSSDIGLVELLSRRALLNPAALLDGELRITRIDRRNQNYRIEGTGGRELFVKRGTASGLTGTLEREAAIYQLLGKPPFTTDFARYLPSLLGYDSVARVLILECLPNAEDLQAYHLRSGRFPDRLATALGTGLASLHRSTRRLATTRRDDSPKLVRPTVFNLAAPRIEVLREASAVNLNVIRIVQKHALFLREFAQLSSEWRTDSLIHGDVKLSNCLGYRKSPKGRVHGVKWIDWEFAGLGDPRWDVGSVFTSYLALWVCSIPIPRSDKPELLLDSARISLATVQRNLRCFIRSYLEAAALETPSVRAWISSCVRMAGARLVQTAYEFAAGASELTAPVLTLLQMALNVLERPERAAIELLGLDEQALAVRPAPEVGLA